VLNYWVLKKNRITAISIFWNSGSKTGSFVTRKKAPLYTSAGEKERGIMDNKELKRC
jgi:hypothetical protein